MTAIRKGQYPGALSRDQFSEQFQRAYLDPAYDVERAAIARLEAIAWDAYCKGRKSPLHEKAGPEFADPDYDMSTEWRRTRDKLRAAEARQKNPATRSRVLLIVGASRNDGTCPGEMSKTFRLMRIAREVVDAAGIESDVLDLSNLVSDYKRRIFPCKGCVSTAMPLCHWPCSCYPNHALGQTGDWMAEIYEQWVAAHGVLILTPVYWYQVASPLKLMIDRLVCADGGNPDLSSTSGKDAKKAKALELAGWPYPKHLGGRTYGVVVHGDVAGIEAVRRALCDWLDWMGLVDAGSQARLDRYIGYYEPYATSHDALDADTAVQEEVRNVARALVEAVRQLRAGRLSRPDAGLRRSRPK
ncbi:MAG: flavodoxin family protein [Rhodospirillaceae bacterium]